MTGRLSTVGLFYWGEKLQPAQFDPTGEFLFQSSAIQNDHRKDDGKPMSAKSYI